MAIEFNLSAGQESALRESTETGEWHPMTHRDARAAEYLTRRGLFARRMHPFSGALAGYRLTAAGRDWLDTHPVVTRV